MTQSNNPQRRLGLGMMAIAWLLGLGLLAWMFQDDLDRQYNPNAVPHASRSSTGALQVRLEPNRQYHYLAGATLNGHPVTLLVDTGASDVVIPARLARQLQLPELGSGYAITANGRTRITRTQLDHLHIGPIQLENLTASIAEGYQAEEILFGMSALRHLNFRSEGGALILEQQ